jgi:hypothetical protein
LLDVLGFHINHLFVRGSAPPATTHKLPTSV